MNEEAALLPKSVRTQFQQSLAKCRSCLDTQAYLAQLGETDAETRDRANHLHATVSKALELDRQAQQG